MHMLDLEEAFRMLGGGGEGVWANRRIGTRICICMCMMRMRRPPSPTVSRACLSSRTDIGVAERPGGGRGRAWRRHRLHACTDAHAGTMSRISPLSRPPSVRETWEEKLALHGRARDEKM